MNKRKLTFFIVSQISTLKSICGSDWPRNYCADSCCLIFKDLKKSFPNEGWGLIKGAFCPKQYFYEEHTWIQSRDGIIVDPTAKQFSKRLPYISFPNSHFYSFYKHLFIN